VSSHDHRVRDSSSQLSLLAVVSFAVPAGLLLLIALTVARNAWDVHNSIVGLAMAWTMTGVVTQIIKVG
jgi:diacylglycerol diphosphate phosphatase/phosphatidate phosphatase